MEKAEIQSILREIPMFTELDEEHYARITAHCAVHEHEKGDLLFSEGEPYLGLYVVLKGAVKVFRMSPDGKETVLHIIFPIQTLAEIPMFAGADYPAHAECIMRSTVLFARKEPFLELLRDNPELSLRMLAGLSKRLRTLAVQIEDLTAHDIRTRVIRYLLDEYGRQDDGKKILPLLRLPVSKSLLAVHLGTTLETLSRTMRKLEGEGKISMKGKSVLLQDLSGLRKEYKLSSGH